jgi:hypothetical protein
MKLIAAATAAALSVAVLAGCGDGRSATDISSAASVMANQDGNDAAGDSYAQALTTLNGRCTQTPDQVAVDVGIAHDAMKAAGSSANQLAILQALVKVSAATSGKGKVDCDPLAKALTVGVQGG